VTAAIADRDHELGLGRRVVRAPQRDGHVLGNGPGHEQHVRVPGARDEPDAEALDVVVRVAERVDLELAGVAGAGVDLPDRQRAAEDAQDVVLQPRDAGRIGGRRGRILGLDAGDRDLLQDVQHGAGTLTGRDRCRSG
jgi:hypothetical protein